MKSEINTKVNPFSLGIDRETGNKPNAVFDLDLKADEKNVKPIK